MILASGCALWLTPIRKQLEQQMATHVTYYEKRNKTYCDKFRAEALREVQTQLLMSDWTWNCFFLVLVSHVSCAIILR